MEGKRLKIGGGGGEWSQVLDGVLGGLGEIEEIKSPCCCRGLGGIVLLLFHCRIGSFQS